jgi:hypothetical protein
MMRPIWGGVLLSVIGVLGAAASMITLGLAAAAVAAVLVAAASYVCLKPLRPILRKNLRGVSLIDALSRAGLVDVELRSESDRSLPPHRLYDVAKREVVVSGVSAASSFHSHLGTLKAAVGRGVHLYFLICHPETKGLDELGSFEKRDIREDVKTVIKVIKEEGLRQHPRFGIRFLRALPTFTAVLVDGDVAPAGLPPADSEGVVRVQPRRMLGSHHDGIILQFRKASRGAGFDVFAAELREQWKAASDDPALWL